MDDMIVTRKVIICPGRREKSQAREFTMPGRHGDGSFVLTEQMMARHGDGSFVLTEQMMDDMIVTRKVIICPGRREKSQAREFTM